MNIHIQALKMRLKKVFFQALMNKFDSTLPETQYTVFELKPAREKISSKQNERQG